jgi:hypothetical protein
MARLATLTFLSATLVVAQPAASTGQPAAAAQASPILNAPPAENPAPTAPRRNRAISSEVAAALAAATPKYTPPPPKPPPKPEEEQVDLRDIDKPKNTIVRLPKYIVQEKRPAVFRERDIYTEKGLTDIAMRRYISDFDRALNRWTLPFIGMSKESRALAMYAEDERLRNMSDLKDAATNASKADAATGDYIRKESQKTFLRSGDYGWNGGGPH